MSISQLFVYPVKSLRGIAVNSAVITSQGLLHDRQWMVIDENNNFVTQRKTPQMVLVKTRLTEHALVLQKEGMPDLSVPFDLPDSQAFSATVWRDQCEVVAEADNINTWVTEALQNKGPLRLARLARQAQRPTQSERFGQTTIQFADAAPYLICNQASLSELNDRLLGQGFDSITVERFRPNIVLDDSANLPAFAEHNLKRIAGPDYTFTSCDPCQRCIVPNVDLNTAEKHPQQQPYKTLVDINPMPDNHKAAAFGQNATLRSGDGNTINIGDSITLEL